MRISAEEVRTTAWMARLELTDEEVRRMTGELDAILGYMEKLGKLDVTGVEPTTHAVPLECPLRTDELGEQLPVEAALGDAPRAQDQFFEVPKIIETGS